MKAIISKITEYKYNEQAITAVMMKGKVAYTRKLEGLELTSFVDRYYIERFNGHGLPFTENMEVEINATDTVAMVGTEKYKTRYEATISDILGYGEDEALEDQEQETEEAEAEKPKAKAVSSK